MLNVTYPGGAVQKFLRGSNPAMAGSGSTLSEASVTMLEGYLSDSDDEENSRARAEHKEVQGALAARRNPQPSILNIHHCIIFLLFELKFCYQRSLISSFLPFFVPGRRGVREESSKYLLRKHVLHGYPCGLDGR